VRILFDADQPDLAALRPGLSTTVTVRLDAASHVSRPSPPQKTAQLLR
jgi:multidrug resistance efflux pump